MRIIVQKFGGTSVATDESRSLVTQKILQAQKRGFSPVVVVSAMGRKGAPYATDTLIGVAKKMNPKIHARELDHIMCCGEIISASLMAGLLQAAGCESVMLTGGQAGIATDENYGNAHILQIDKTNILRVVGEGKIPVVCGFQGISSQGSLTTLGRGGSDTSAAALGAALDAEMVEIYTDVDGIMTADPRIVSKAKLLDRISYGEVCQLAHQGAKVIHPRAVEIAMQKNIPLMIKSTFSSAKGTLISNFEHDPAMIDAAVSDRIATGVTYLQDICQIKINHVDRNASVDVFKVLANLGISVDLINVYPGKLLFTIAQKHAAAAKAKLEELKYYAEFIPECAKVSVIGGGMREVPGVMANFVEALLALDIEILQAVDSHTSISVLIKQAEVGDAVRALHEKFNLSSDLS